MNSFDRIFDKFKVEHRPFPEGATTCGVWNEYHIKQVGKDKVLLETNHEGTARFALAAMNAYSGDVILEDTTRDVLVAKQQEVFTQKGEV